MRKVLFIWLLFVASPIVLADTSIGPVTIKKIETGWGSEGIFISTTEGTIVEGCSTAGIRFNRDHLMLKEILSIALSAYHSRSKVQLRISGCSGTLMNGIAIAVLD